MENTNEQNIKKLTIEFDENMESYRIEFSEDYTFTNFGQAILAIGDTITNTADPTIKSFLVFNLTKALFDVVNSLDINNKLSSIDAIIDTFNDLGIDSMEKLDQLIENEENEKLKETALQN